jgi:hypothetical protein
LLIKVRIFNLPDLLEKTTMIGQAIDKITHLLSAPREIHWRARRSLLIHCQPLRRPTSVQLSFQTACCVHSRPPLPQEGIAAAINRVSTRRLRQLSSPYPKRTSHHSPPVLAKIHLPTILLSPGSLFRSLKPRVDPTLFLIYVVSTTPGVQRTYLRVWIAT